MYHLNLKINLTKIYLLYGVLYRLYHLNGTGTSPYHPTLLIFYSCSFNAWFWFCSSNSLLNEMRCHSSVDSSTYIRGRLMGCSNSSTVCVWKIFLNSLYSLQITQTLKYVYLLFLFFLHSWYDMAPSLYLNNNGHNRSIWPGFGNLKVLHVLDLSHNGLRVHTRFNKQSYDLG